jgi:hypothetical protein
MMVAIEVNQVVTKTYFAEVPDGTTGEDILDAVVAVRDKWEHDPELDDVDDNNDVAGILELTLQGDPGEYIWPKEDTLGE